MFGSKRTHAVGWDAVLEIAEELLGDSRPSVRQLGRNLKAIAHERGRTGMKRNPPRGKSDFSNRVYSLAYRHEADGGDYQHEFDPGVSIESNDDGTVTLYRRDRKPVWEDGYPG